MGGEQYIGKKVKGFKFESGAHRNLYYTSEMDNLIGVEGVIFRHSPISNSYDVLFDRGFYWSYPAELVEEQLLKREYPLTPEECFEYKHYKKKEHTYRIVEEIKTKVDGEWKDFILYEQIYTGKRFSREKEEFFAKFNEEVTLTFEELREIVSAEITNNQLREYVKKVMAKRQK